ncbi:MAG: STAS domain-containing protein [Pseudomonadota bacterium]
MPDDKLYLPEHFDGTTVSQVAAELLKRRGHPVALNAERVKTAGALGLQVLASTTKQWRQDNAEFEVLNASEDLVHAAETLGIAPADLGVSDLQVAP